MRERRAHVLSDSSLSQSPFPPSGQRDTPPDGQTTLYGWMDRQTDRQTVWGCCHRKSERQALP